MGATATGLDPGAGRRSGFWQTLTAAPAAAWSAAVRATNWLRGR
jgi:hypothetical protein